MGPSRDRPHPYILCCSSSLSSQIIVSHACFLSFSDGKTPLQMEEINYLMIMSPQTYRRLRMDNVNPCDTAPSINQRIMHKLITHPETPFPHLAFKNALLKPSGEFGVLGARAIRLLAWPLNKPFSAPNSDVLVLFGLTVRGAHELVLG